jgi:uncharacterized membrane protein
LWLAIVLTAIVIEAQPAHAGFNICNQFERRIDVAFGYVDRERGWVAQGWWIMDAGQCKTVHGGDLDNRYYYLFVRGVGGAMWTGEVPFCIQKKKFLLVQAEYGKNTRDDCAKAGLEYAQFFKVDVGKAKDHTYNLTASNTAGVPGGTPAGEPQQPPVATVPQQQQPYPQQQQPPQQQAPYQPPQQTYQQTPPTYQQPPPNQQTPQTSRPPVATQQPQPQPYRQQAPQPPQYQQPPQQTPPAAPPGGGTACQRYPNLC